MSQSDTTALTSGTSVVARVWPPAGLALGLIATVAWIGFLVVKLLNLFGLAL